MSVQIDVGSFRLESYELGWTVGKLSVRKSGEREGEDYLTRQSYYPRLEMAVNALTDSALRESEAETFGELRRDLDAIKAQLLELLVLSVPEPSDAPRRRRRSR